MTCQSCFLPTSGGRMGRLAAQGHRSARLFEDLHQLNSWQEVDNLSLLTGQIR